MSTSRVLVPLDGSELAERALPVAAWAARALGAEVALLSAAADAEEAERLEAYLNGLASPALPPPAARAVVVERDATAAIRDAAVDPSTLVCLASHGWGRSAGPLGSVATVVAAQLGRPTLVVGPRAQPGAAGAPVLACVDGSSASEVVFGPACEWAVALRAPLHVLTVYEPVPGPDRHGRFHRRHGPEVDADGYVAALAEGLRAAGEAAPDVDGVAVADPLSPSDGVASHLAAHPAQLLVLSTHARTGLARFVLGSEAGRIIGRSIVPALTVPLAS